MAVFRPFAAVRPDARYAQDALCPPYDVVSRDEAIRIISGNPASFMNVIRADAAFDPDDAYSDAVYEQSRKNLEALLKKGIYIEDGDPHFYIYSETFMGRTQTGIAGCASIDDYENGVIRKHEVTTIEKETDRIKHFSACMADTEPIFLTYRGDAGINEITKKITENCEPDYEATDDDGVIHRLWVVRDENTIGRITEIFAGIPSMYIADGHHRTASAVHVGMKLRAEDPDPSADREYNRFLAIAFPEDDLCVLPYNRIVTTLNGMAPEAFIKKMESAAEIKKIEDPGRGPAERHTVYVYTGGSWYSAAFKSSLIDEEDPVKSLDVYLLQEYVFSPVLGIKDPRKDERLVFSGGIGDHQKLADAVDSGMAAAFELCPVTVGEIINVADSGMIMPPKSTWFEPKIGSGWLVHRIG
ncbi:MAG: DUF1015 domain-containing protein [Anaerovoracaceae bacterium]|jgi:uncharacterized protein (DUF1015 family)